MANLTGRWKCSDGGVYYIRQVGEEVMWYGELESITKFSNVAVGNIGGNNLILRWMDVPKSSNANEGILVLKIAADGKKMTLATKEGSFGGAEWTKV